MACACCMFPDCAPSVAPPAAPPAPDAVVDAAGGAELAPNAAALAAVGVGIVDEDGAGSVAAPAAAVATGAVDTGAVAVTPEAMDPAGTTVLTIGAAGPVTAVVVVAVVAVNAVVVAAAVVIVAGAPTPPATPTTGAAADCGNGIFVVSGADADASLGTMGPGLTGAPATAPAEAPAEAPAAAAAAPGKPMLLFNEAAFGEFLSSSSCFFSSSVSSILYPIHVKAQ